MLEFLLLLLDDVDDEELDGGDLVVVEVQVYSCIIQLVLEPCGRWPK